MPNRTSPAATAMRRATLAASLAAVLGLPLRSFAGAEATRDHANPAAPMAPALHTVNTCVDDINLQGSLRYEVLHAANNDIIDLTSLEMVCSTITLGTEIEVTQDYLNLQGPGAESLTIDGNNYSRVFKHTGAGTLHIDGLTIANGYYIDSNKPFGGCIYSHGSVWLVDSLVSTCTVSSASATIPARGGGVYSKDTTALKYSEISNNQAIAHYGARAYGGGAYTRDLQSRYSTISGNVADVFGIGAGSNGGGVQFDGNGYVANSTVDKNRADVAGGLYETGATSSTTIVNSTISSNEAVDYAGLVSRSPATIENSTIAFNIAMYGFGAGVRVHAVAPLILRSSIVAGNSGFQQPSDLDGNSTVVTGSNNLVTSSTLPLPMGTLTDCPQLGRLADNGGPTRTHALSHTSPAIDQGDAGSLNVDQRFEPRVAGAAADIGAFELQSGEADERIFVSGFDKLCDQ